MYTILLIKRLIFNPLSLFWKNQVWWLRFEFQLFKVPKTTNLRKHLIITGEKTICWIQKQIYYTSVIIQNILKMNYITVFITETFPEAKKDNSQSERFSRKTPKALVTENMLRSKARNTYFNLQIHTIFNLKYKSIFFKAKPWKRTSKFLSRNCVNGSWISAAQT